MTSLALRPARLAFPILGELVERQRALAAYGLTLLLLALLAVAMQTVDPRTLASGDGVWVKPAKFFASVGLFSLTIAWFFGYVRPERRGSWLMRGTVGMVFLAGSFELGWIAWQGVNGLESHFNLDTLFYRRMFNLMGLFAVLLVGTTLPLAWEIGRRPAAGLSGDFVAAVAIGLVLTVLLGGSFGGAIAANGGHAVGPEAGAVPVFGWNRGGGDLRIAHFAGIHAMQAIPVIAAIAAGLAARVRRLILLAGSLLYVAAAVALYAQAVAARPLLPL
jgi:hypothetical protein